MREFTITLGVAGLKRLAILASKSKEIALLNNRTIEECLPNIWICENTLGVKSVNRSC